MLLSIPSAVKAQDFSLYQKETFDSSEGELPYRILYPKEYTTEKEYPLLVFLHGSGERGTDNELQLVHGADLFLQEDIRTNFPSIVVFPQCPREASWNNAIFMRIGNKNHFEYPKELEFNAQLNALEELITQLSSQQQVDRNKIYIGGLSMGGMGTFEMLHRNPKLFAGALAICGGANPEIAPKIKDTPIWIFHGTDDNVVPSSYSKDLHTALEKVGAKSTLTLYPKVKHDSWTNVFTEPELLPWLFSQSLVK